jgi:hypothetical protein
MAVGDIDFGLTFEGVDPNPMAGIESAVWSVWSNFFFGRVFANGLDVLKIFVESADPLGAVTVDDVDIAISRYSDIGRIGPIDTKKTS